MFEMWRGYLMRIVDFTFFKAYLTFNKNHNSLKNLFLVNLKKQLNRGNLHKANPLP